MKRLIKFAIWSTFLLCLLVVSAGVALWYIWSSNLPYIGSLREYRPPIITKVFSDDGQMIGRFWKEKRIVVSLDMLPKHLINAFIAAEDARFFKHEGVDFLSIIRALFKNLIAGRIEQGGSTITQQVTRSLLLKNPKKTYKRKVREAILSLQIEKSFSKERILFLYLNQIYMGHGAYGVEAAARTYFNKRALELNLAESSLLAGLPQAPSKYSPIFHFERARARQKYVLSRMREVGFINEYQEKEALDSEIIFRESEENSFKKAPYFTEYIRRYLKKKYGEEMLYKGGLKVFTTLDLKMQRFAQDAIRKGLLELDKREGYRGTIKHLSSSEMDIFREEAARKFIADPPEINDIVEGLVESVDDLKGEVIINIGGRLGHLPMKGMKWARKPNPKIPYFAAYVKKPGNVLRKGDVVLVRIKDKQKEDQPINQELANNYDWQLSLEQEPKVQGALFCMEAETGRVKSMIGGRDFSISQFNRATQSRRQPGSAFKPIIYAAALDWGMTPVSVIIDSPFISKMNSKNKIWKPKNYKERFYGPTLLRTGLIKSRNVITVKILKKIGVGIAIKYAKKMGIESDLTPNLSLALGSSGLSLAEITRAYSVFANGGGLVELIFINRIEDRNDQIIEENQPVVRESISKETAFVMTDLLKAVIREGTGWRVKELKRPAAGKTGTTNDLKDAWFLGFTPGLVTGVWVGYDDRSSMGKEETGSRAASPIWLYFMSDVLNERPVQDFPIPEGVIFAKIDAEKGLLASPHSKKTIFQAFIKGKEPEGYTPRPRAAKSGQFSQFDMDAGQ